MPVQKLEQFLDENENVAFDAGSHTELVRLPYADSERLVGPVAAPVAAEG